MSSTKILVGSLAAVTAAAASAPTRVHAQASCPTTSPPSSWNGALLDTGTTRAGTVYDGSGGGRLELSRNGEQFSTTQLTATSNTVYAAVGDFNKDGWPDFVGAPENTTTALTVFQNFTWQNENCTTAACTAYSGAAPDWTNPTLVITPKFTSVRTLGSGFDGLFSLTAADFNGDGWDDIFMAYAPNSRSGIDDPITTLTMFLNQASNDTSGNPRFLSGYAAQSGFTITNVLGDQTWSGTNIQSVDYNKDGRQDILIGSDKQNGSIRILLNNCIGVMQASGVVRCTINPAFTDGGYLKSDLASGTSGFGTSAGGLPTFAYGDIDLDGLRDLVVGAPNCCSTASHRLRLFKGCSGGTGCTAGLENTASQNLSFNGAATAIFIADFSLDGKPDLAVATDGKNYNTSINGGTTFYYRNNGTSTPFSAGVTQQLTQKGTSGGRVDDYDVGILFDYDRDPTRSPDMMVANGNDTNGYYVIADRISPKYVDCGEAASGVMELGNLVDLEMVITAARITPSLSLNGGTMTFWLSNEEPPNWVQASLCTGSTTDYCVSFPKAVGRSVRWKAIMCSNATHTTTPVLTTMAAKFDYTRAHEHYRAGVVVSDGLAYVGALHQPGERGRFYATTADLTSPCSGVSSSPVCWDAATKLDAMADANRKIYTAQANLALRIDFTTANAAQTALQTLLATADTAATTALISWVRSARFGLGNPTIPLTKLGAVETSTPAIVGKPGRPAWYSFVTGIERSRIEAFIAANATRKPLVLFGSKDGMIHAVHSRASDIANVLNGQEAWAFIPPTVARSMVQDYTATLAANAAAADGRNHPTIAAYPDGSPTLVDYHAGNGVYKTVALIAEGNGGRSITALDVTQTVEPLTGTVLGPTPMWSATPGDGEAGQAYAKPAVARVLIANEERYVVVAATGVDYTDTLGQKGRVVAGYDLRNGQLMWKFQAKCPVTSDLTVFETDDTGEPGAPAINGFADRVVFADKCGYVYKLAPGVDLAGDWYDNTGMGSIVANTAPGGKPQLALFSTKLSSGALGSDRPITGTLGARSDSSTRMVLLFGTGGLENVAQTSVNEFYAVYADTGAIRSKVTGACNASGACEKFYGGTVVTPEQVIFTRTTDPTIGSSTCDRGSSTVQAVELNANTQGQFVTDFQMSVSSAVMGALYGDAGAIHFATLAGDVARIGTPRAPTPGADTAAGATQGMGVGDQGGAGQTVGTTAPFMLMGWRMVL